MSACCGFHSSSARFSRSESLLCSRNSTNLNSIQFFRFRFGNFDVLRYRRSGGGIPLFFCTTSLISEIVFFISLKTVWSALSFWSSTKGYFVELGTVLIEVHPTTTSKTMEILLVCRYVEITCFEAVLGFCNCPESGLVVSSTALLYS